MGKSALHRKQRTLRGCIGVLRAGRVAVVMSAVMTTVMNTVMTIVLTGCIVVPQTQTVYDPECRMHTRQVTLQAAYLGGFHSCAGEGCVAMLAAVGVVTAASVVVSGSIALVGNVVYWMERQGRCPRAPAPAYSPASAASAAVLVSR